MGKGTSLITTGLHRAFTRKSTAPTPRGIMDSAPTWTTPALHTLPVELSEPRRQRIRISDFAARAGDQRCRHRSYACAWGHANPHLAKPSPCDAADPGSRAGNLPDQVKRSESVAFSTPRRLSPGDMRAQPAGSVPFRRWINFSKFANVSGESPASRDRSRSSTSAGLLWLKRSTASCRAI